MLSKKLIIHLGFPKTGTTALQENFFSKIENIEYIGKPYESKWKQKLQDAIFNNSVVNPVIDSKHNINIWSEENFLYFKHYKDGGLIKKLKKIKTIFFNYDIEILIIIRNHKEIIKSTFQQFEEDLKSLNINLNELNLDYKHSSLNNDQKSFINLYNYYFIYNELLEIFSDHQIHFLLYEDMNKNPNVFLDQILQKYGIKSKKKFSLKKKMYQIINLR